MKKSTPRNSKLPSAYALVCCLAVSTCNAFQTSQPTTAFGSFSSSSSTTFRTMPLHAASMRLATPVERKTRTKPKQAKNIRVADNTTKRRRGRPSNAERAAAAAALPQTSSRMKRKSHPNDFLSLQDALIHDLLTKEQEKDLGEKIQRASKLKANIAKFVRYQEINMEIEAEEHGYHGELTSDMLDDQYPNLGVQAVDDQDIDGLSVFGVPQNRLEALDGQSLTSSMDEEMEGSWNFERLQETDYNIVEITDKSSSSSAYLPKSRKPSIDEILTEEDVVAELGIKGGRDELARIILDGALAKEKMISSNVRLVLSIAKTWCQRSSSFSGAAQYTGSWDRPSLDEAIQEGILGLSIAAERFEPERNLKFATYATWWVTNSVRSCFNKAKEVGLRVPVYFHVYRQRYQAYVKEQYDLTGKAVQLEDVARELDLTPKRLAFILQSTTAPVSIDAPPNAFQRVGMAGKAGSDDSNDQSTTLSANLKSPDASLEDQIEISFLRQCLENAMATELSPHERDILRLRHGLDDGVSRTAREVAEIFGESVSLSDVRSVEMRACRKLRSPYSVHTARLHDFLDFVGADMSTAKTQ